MPRINYLGHATSESSSASYVKALSRLECIVANSNHNKHWKVCAGIDVTNGNERVYNTIFNI